MPKKARVESKTYEYKFSSIHAYRRDKGNYLDLVNTKFIKEKFDNDEFLKWNELDNHDRCMEVMNNRLTNFSESLDFIIINYKN